MAADLVCEKCRFVFLCLFSLIPVYVYARPAAAVIQRIVEPSTAPSDSAPAFLPLTAQGSAKSLPWQIEALVYSFTSLQDVTALFLSSKGMARAAVRYIEQMHELRVHDEMIRNGHIHSLPMMLASMHCKSLQRVFCEARDTGVQCNWQIRLLNNNTHTLRWRLHQNKLVRQSLVRCRALEDLSVDAKDLQAMAKEVTIEGLPRLNRLQVYLESGAQDCDAGPTAAAVGQGACFALICFAVA